MADYIQKSILFQAYVHIDADFEQIAPEGGSEARSYLHSYIDDRSKHFLDSSVETTLEFKEGSIKAYATVCGTLSACLPPAYTDFVVAINQLFWFTKKLSGAAVMELSFKTNSYLSAIERTEARPGIIGQAKRVVDELLSLAVLTSNPADWDRNREKLTRKLMRTYLDTDRLLAVLSSAEDDKLVKKEFLKLLNKVPSTLAQRRQVAGAPLLPYESGYLDFRKMLKKPR